MKCNTQACSFQPTRVSERNGRPLTDLKGRCIPQLKERKIRFLEGRRPCRLEATASGPKAIP
jgi:hypothetical protein